MTVAFQTGYVLPDGDLPLTHARMLHKGNRFKARSIVASSAAMGYDAEAADNAMTDDPWKPFTNQLSDASNFTSASWTKVRMTVSGDNKTLFETDETGAHLIQYAGDVDVDGSEYVLSFRVKLNGGRSRFLLRSTAGGVQYDLIFDVGLGRIYFTSFLMDGYIKQVGEDEYQCTGYYTPAAGTISNGIVLLFYDEVNASSYPGDVDQGVQLLEVVHHKSQATYDLGLYAPALGDAFCIAGHNVGGGLGRFVFSHDSNLDDTFDEIGKVLPVDDGPVMFIHEGVTSARWRVSVERCPLPSISVIRAGKLLQWDRPFYVGASPSSAGRVTETRGNTSNGGNFIGRSKSRTGFAVTYPWSGLSVDWLDGIMPGRDGVQRSLEDEPFFLAWRPIDRQDCDYAWTDGSVPPWVIEGPRIASLSIAARCLGYE